MSDFIQLLVSGNPQVLLGVASFISGVCLLYLVMGRTIAKRQREAEEPSDN